MLTSSPQRNLPIGVFDSGIGGLTVLKSLSAHLPQESFIYLGDTARLPYGTKSPETVARYSIQACSSLIKQGIKMLVVACNTASALALPALQANFPNIPIVGVLQPSAKAACTVTRTRCIGIIATEATIKSGGYQNVINTIDPEAIVIAKSCSLLVALVEEGWTEGHIAECVVDKYLQPLFKNEYKPDCLILGCTHFPVMLKTIEKILAGKNVTIVDSAHATAENVVATLNNLELRHNNPSYPSLKFMVTDSPERFLLVGQNFMPLTGTIEYIDLIG